VAKRGIELWAFTPVFAPSGLSDTLVHAWSRDGRECARVRLPLLGGRAKGFRVWSSSALAAAGRGTASVETFTGEGQLVGRMTIPVP